MPGYLCRTSAVLALLRTFGAGYLECILCGSSLRLELFFFDDHIAALLGGRLPTRTDLPACRGMLSGSSSAKASLCFSPPDNLWVPRRLFIETGDVGRESRDWGAAAVSDLIIGRPRSILYSAGRL